MHMVFSGNLSQRLFFATVAIISFTGNVFFIAIIIRNRKLLRKAYHKIILSLAITDMMTGIFLVLTPEYIIGQKPALSRKNVGSAMFCYVIGNQYLVFTFGIVSLYTVTLLAVERWFAVFRPFEHRTTFRIHKVQQYLIIIWIASFAANSTHIIETKYFLDNVNITERCVFQGVASREVRVIIGVAEIFLKFLIPVLVLLVSFIHLYRFMKDSHVTAITRPSNYIALTRVTLMAAVTSLVMVLCWFPNQLVYLLFKLEVVQLNTPLHKATVIVCMFNSCLNPCIFLLSNKLYRKKAKELLPRCRGSVKDFDLSSTESKKVVQSVVSLKFLRGNFL
ncbi:probable G-protein coupled receptor 83 [Stylophora pistillata]|uniref:probable G-protein coupled receptor 83 n=1 Tax=Stylophora pistillata TaxID=50429 RepID=UPI000C0543C5|nr:probable G-protein coupled receptor 83 [Stylophora pistillata]